MAPGGVVRVSTVLSVPAASGLRPGAAHDEWDVLSQGDAQFLRSAVARLQGRERPIEPACLQAVSLRRTVFQHVLAVEMRTLAIRASDGVEYNELACRVRIMEE